MTSATHMINSNSYNLGQAKIHSNHFLRFRNKSFKLNSIAPKDMNPFRYRMADQQRRLKLRYVYSLLVVVASIAFTMFMT